jgi:hypothetical protein
MLYYRYMSLGSHFVWGLIRPIEEVTQDDGYGLLRFLSAVAPDSQTGPHAVWLSTPDVAPLP